MKSKRILIGVVSVVVAGAIGYGVRAKAAGIPAMNALTYAGVLESANGPVSGIHSIQVALYDGTGKKCESAKKEVDIINGHFSVQLPDECTAAVAANPELQAHVFVDDADTGATRLGAVPYAVEANHAVSSDVAKPGSALDGRLAALEKSDVFNAVWKGTYPIVLSSYGSSPFFCGPAPDTLELNLAPASALSASFGSLVFTDQGSFAQFYHGPFTGSGCADNLALCAGPLTFFLKNPGSKKAITITAHLDNGPSYFYVDGNTGPNKFKSTGTGGAANVSVDVPSGSFALSAVICSTDGPTNAIIITSKFITENNLQVDYERTFHRNGQ